MTRFLMTATVAALTTLALATACSKKPEAGGEGVAYNPANGGTAPANAAPGSATYGDGAAMQPGATPPATPTTGANAGAASDTPPPTAANTPADGRVDR
jgi:hypothetical protein